MIGKCGHRIGLGYEGENFAYLVFFLFSCYVVMVATFKFNKHYTISIMLYARSLLYISAWL